MNWPEVRAWRKTARAKLIAARIAVPASLRAEWTAQLIAHLKPLLMAAPAPISFYWPFKAEPDFRPLMRELDAAGIAVALPVAFKLGEPMTFRPWHRRCEMTRGIWDIPIPADPTEVLPRTVIAPIVGFDPANFRLGYGGGFFDRTLKKLGGAKLGDRAQAIGVGFSMFRLETIHPQPHDIPMARIVTEAAESLSVESAGKVCYADEMTADYAGFASSAEIADMLILVGDALAPERKAMATYLLWRLGVNDEYRALLRLTEAQAIDLVKLQLPRVQDDCLHAGLRALIA
jgi:5-formyltetrahydrofolate cyclo-ligase